MIIIGDSNANAMLQHFKGNTNRSNHVVKGGARAAEILGLLKAHFKKNYPSLSEQTRQKRTPKAALIHMGYNGPSRNLQAMKDTVVFLKEKGIEDIRIVDIKVDTPKRPRFEKNIKALSAELKKLPSQYPGVSIVPNNGELNSKLPEGDGYHYTGNGYKQIIKDSLSGVTFNVSAADAASAGAAATVAAAEPEAETAVSSGTLNISNPRATEMISDVEKFLGSPLSDSQTQNLENIYKAVISELSFIKDKGSWNAYRYAVGYKESGNKYNPYKASGAWRDNRYTARYAIGPGPYKVGRQIMSKYGVVLPNYKYIGDKKWSPGSQEKYYKDPIAQEGSFAGFAIHNKNMVKGYAKDAKDELALPGIAHNIGPGGMRRWAKIREEYRKTKDVKHLYRLWSLQDGYGTPGENFARISLRQTGQKIPDLPQGWLWYYKDSEGNVRRDYDKLEQIKQFDEKLGNYLEKGWPFCGKISCDPRIFAFTKEDYAERVWKWVMNSGQANSTKRNSANNKSKNIQDYYNENGDPIGSPAGTAFTSTPATDTVEKEPKSKTVSFFGANDAAIASFDDAVTALEQSETLKDIILRYVADHGTQRNKVVSTVIELENKLKQINSGDLSSFRNRKFRYLTDTIHDSYRDKFRIIYNDLKKTDEEKANETMAFLHRPRLLVSLKSDRMLFTRTSDFSVSFELGKPFGDQSGVLIGQWPFFSDDKFGNSPEKNELRRIISQNKELFLKYREKVQSLGPGQYGSRDLNESDKNIYLRYFNTLHRIFTLAEDSLSDGGSMIRKAWVLENLGSVLYLL